MSELKEVQILVRDLCTTTDPIWEKYIEHGVLVKAQDKWYYKDGFNAPVLLYPFMTVVHAPHKNVAMNPIRFTLPTYLCDAWVKYVENQIRTMEVNECDVTCTSLDLESVDSQLRHLQKKRNALQDALKTRRKAQDLAYSDLCTSVEAQQLES